MSSRLSKLLCVDAEFFHSREESRAVHSQARGSTISTTHASLACGKRPYDLIALLSCDIPQQPVFVISPVGIFSRSASVPVRTTWVVFSAFVFRSSPSGASSELPRVRITARSMKFSSSRIFPGQSQAVSPFITAVGIASIFFCICFENFCTK